MTSVSASSNDTAVCAVRTQTCCHDQHRTFFRVVCVIRILHFLVFICSFVVSTCTTVILGEHAPAAWRLWMTSFDMGCMMQVWTDLSGGCWPFLPLCTHSGDAEGIGHTYSLCCDSYIYIYIYTCCFWLKIHLLSVTVAVVPCKVTISDNAMPLYACPQWSFTASSLCSRLQRQRGNIPFCYKKDPNGLTCRGIVNY